MSGQSTPTLPNLNPTYEPEMDTFFDLDQNDYSPSLSPSTSRSQSIAQRSAIAGPSNSSFATQSQPPMSGPSHQYDAYRQQTGLPAGGLASTFAVNQATGLQYTGNSNGFVMPVETLNFPLPSTDEFDFNSNPSYDMNDMDFDADSPAADNLMFYPGKTQQFVNPSAIGGGEPSTYTPQVQRMYPGMHSQAAQAKAAQRKQQQDLARQQQQHRALEGQRPLPSQKSPVKSDPAVDERISRLLHQMRQNSTASQSEDGDTPTGLPHIAKMKKEEDEMDEDERLLASEEGKKLSSKERRQLRNKVSARAFRSRRKEYIGQLEGEVAQKVQEANELRVENSQLLEENARLTDLTRMLLSSPAFSGFLNELSVNGGSIPSALQKTTSVQPAQPRPQPQPTRKDINPHHAARQMQSQNQHQVGMVMVPEPSVDFASMEMTPSNGWNSGIDMSSFQVFAVTELPEGPVIDVNALSGKSASSSESKHTASKDVPCLPSLPVLHKEVKEPEVNIDIKLDASLSLFIDSPAQNTPSSSAPQSFDGITSQKPQQYDLVVSSASTTESLENMCAILDASCARLESLTSHL